MFADDKITALTDIGLTTPELTRLTNETDSTAAYARTITPHGRNPRGGGLSTSPLVQRKLLF